MYETGCITLIGIELIGRMNKVDSEMDLELQNINYIALCCLIYNQQGLLSFVITAKDKLNTNEFEK